MNLYKIVHCYDIGDQSAYLRCHNDPTNLALYCQFMAEEWFDEGVSLSNKLIAKALIQHYGCTPATADSKDELIEIDMHFARESYPPDSYKALITSSDYVREGLKEFLLAEGNNEIMEAAKKKAIQLPNEEVKVALYDDELFTVTYLSALNELKCSRSLDTQHKFQ